MGDAFNFGFYHRISLHIWGLNKYQNVWNQSCIDKKNIVFHKEFKRQSKCAKGNNKSSLSYLLKWFSYAWVVCTSPLGDHQN